MTHPRLDKRLLDLERRNNLKGTCATCRHWQAYIIVLRVSGYEPHPPVCPVCGRRTRGKVIEGHLWDAL